MVRKRSRTSSSRRKTYESDEDNESDLEYESPPSSPAPKRYGLRQRTKKPVFFEDFDYEDEEELKQTSSCSEDEEYNVENDLREKKVKFKITPRRMTNSEAVSVSVSSIEPLIEAEAEEAALDNGLIDFEDVIRADVVVNNRLDNGDVLEKSGSQAKHVGAGNCQPAEEKGRRGRKPKTKAANTDPSDDGNISLEPNLTEDDTNLEVQIDPLHFVRCETVEPSVEPNKNGLKSNKKPLANSNSSKIKIAPSVMDGIEKYVPPKLDEKEKEVVLSNEYLLGNSFDMSADEFLEKQAQKTEENAVVEEEENIPLINFDESDDDVVIIEKKPEIIVLDDD